MARFTNGWIKFYHSAIEGDIGQRPFTLGLFVKLLLWANWKDGSALFCGRRVTLLPGQLITGLRELSPDTSLDPYLHRVRHSLEYLVARGTISQEIGNQGRLITICNWTKYQGGQDCESKQSANEAQTESNRGANEAQLSKDSKKEEGRKKKNTPAFDFGQFWERYPRKIAKSDAQARFDRLIRSQEDFYSLLEALARFRDFHEEKGTESRFIPHPATFLGTKEIPRWRDWLDEGNGKSDIAPSGGFVGLADPEIRP